MVKTEIRKSILHLMQLQLVSMALHILHIEGVGKDKDICHI